MKPTAEQFGGAVSELGAIPYFPTDSGAQLAIMKQLERFVSGPHELRWLVDAAIAAMRGWKGVVELRGLYCTQFRPADGRPDTGCTLPGYTAEECEMRHSLENSERPLLAEPANMADLAKRKAIGRLSVSPALPSCMECEGTGMRTAADDPQLCEWCGCSDGVRKQAEAPDAVDLANAVVLKLRERFQPSGGHGAADREAKD